MLLSPGRKSHERDLLEDPGCRGANPGMSGLCSQELGQQEIEHKPIFFWGGDFQGRNFQIEDW